MIKPVEIPEDESLKVFNARMFRAMNFLIEEHNEILEAGTPAGLAIEREWKDPNQETE